MDPSACVEHIPQNWSRIDVAIYHAYLSGCILNDTNINILVCSQKSVQAKKPSFKKVFTKKASNGQGH